jgi:hypothetical protein
VLYEVTSLNTLYVTKLRFQRHAVIIEAGLSKINSQPTPNHHAKHPESITASECSASGKRKKAARSVQRSPLPSGKQFWEPANPSGAARFAMPPGLRSLRVKI